MLEKIKKIIKKDGISFILIFIISIIIFIPFIKGHYATDTYVIINKGYMYYVMNNSLKDGRIIMVLISEIAAMCNMPINIYISVLTILALFTSCITIIVLKNAIMKYIEKSNKIYELIVITVCYFTIFNFMFIENMHFVECFVMALSILLYTLAAQIFTKKNKYYCLETLILLMFGLICYQGTFSMYLISLVFFLLIEDENLKQKFKSLIFGGILAITSILLQLILIKIICSIICVKQERIGNIAQIKNNIIRIIILSKDVLIYTGFVFPNCVYLIFTGAISALTLIWCKDKKMWCEQLAIIIFSILSGLSISIISGTGFWSARIRYAIGTTIGFMYLHMICKMNLLDLKNKINMVFIGIFATYGIIIVFNYTNIMNNAINVNILDNKQTIEICNYITDYEETNDIEVKKIAVVRGRGNSKAYYPELKYRNSVLSWSAIRTYWAIEGLIEKNCSKDLTQIELTNEEYAYYLKNVDENRDYLCFNDIIVVSYYVH